MKKNVVIVLVLLGLCASSCSKDATQMDMSDLQSKEVMTPRKAGVLQFGSSEEFSEIAAALKERKVLDVKLLPATRAAIQAQESEFVSLRQHLIDQGLKEFSDAELAEIVADSLEYEPEDSLIVDPYMTALLNGDREVQVGDKICRFVEDGMFMYDANEEVLFDPNLVDQMVPADALEHGQATLVTDVNGNEAEFIRINYIQPDEYVMDDGGTPSVDSSSGNDNSSRSDNGSENDNVSYNYDGSITLTNGVRIPRDMIRRATYAKGGGNGSWLSKGLAGIFGLNVSITNNYDKRHRMKLRMYAQDYKIYRAAGMTVRMQKRTFGIWWRKKAQEFRYGWSAIECEYNFSSPTFLDPPKMPNGQFEYDKYPTAITKKFPFADSKIVLFHIPLINYDITTGDVNSVMAKGMKKIVSSIQSWFDDPNNKGLMNNPRGLFTTCDGDRTIKVIFPQGEEVDYGTGREVVRWDKQWLSGIFTVGFKYKLPNEGFKCDGISFPSAKKVSIIRGRIYGAVKYNGQWRACIIETR